MRNLNVHLVIVDPQNDFMGAADGSPLTETLRSGELLQASLAVPGAIADMQRVAQLVERVGAKLSDIHVTLDSHHTMHIAHPDMWVDGNGKQPGPFTIIRADDVANDIWRARNPALQSRMRNYVEALERDGKFLHCIWPPHCRIGTWGHAVQQDLQNALTAWERRHMGVVDYVTKGSSVWTEHFGAVMAQVVDPNDPSTQLNTDFIKLLQEADLIAVAGEALSHCVKTTVEQVAEYIGEEHIKKMVLLTDCMSPVPAAPGTPDFPAIGAAFLKDMQSRGMTLMTSAEFLA